jgi:hypothetical protein
MEIPLEEITEIIVKYVNGKVMSFKGKHVERFIEAVLDNYELSGEEKHPSNDSDKPGSYTSMALSYKKETRSPADIAIEMQKQAAKSLKF